LSCLRVTSSQSHEARPNISVAVSLHADYHAAKLLYDG